MLKHLLLIAALFAGAYTAGAEELTKCLVLKSGDTEVAFFGEHDAAMQVAPTDAQGIYNFTFTSKVDEVTVSSLDSWSVKVESRELSGLDATVVDEPEVEFNGVAVTSKVDAAMQVYDLTGRTVMTASLRGGRAQSLGKLPAGSYIVKVNGVTLKISKK